MGLVQAVLPPPSAARRSVVGAFLSLALGAQHAGGQGAGGSEGAPASASTAGPPVCESTVFQDADGHRHSCAEYRRYGYCEASSETRAWMMSYCANTCKGCAEALQAPELLPVPSGGAKFRTKLCNSTSLFRKLSPVMEKVELADGGLGPATPRIACVVYSYHLYRQRLLDSYATWGQDCDAFLAFSDRAASREEGLGFEVVEVHPDAYEEMGESLWNALVVLQGRVEAGTLDFDFLTMGDDDSLWILPNLRHYLRTSPEVAEARSAGRGLLLGHRLALPWNHSLVFAHFGGIVIDAPAMQAIASCKLPTTLAADPMFAACLAQVGVYPLATEDSLGAQRFNLFDDLTSAVINYDNFTFGPPARYPEWLVAYHEPLRPLQGGLAGVSSESILFHYATGHRRLEMHDQLYHRYVCKQPRAGSEEL